MNQLGWQYASLPDDLLNFQYDPVACAVALGWPGAAVERTHLTFVRGGQLARFQSAADGRSAQILTGLDADGFAEYWLSGVEAAQPQSPRPPRDDPPTGTTGTSRWACRPG